jgi:hypothetical protein
MRVRQGDAVRLGTRCVLPGTSKVVWLAGLGRSRRPRSPVCAVWTQA